MKKFYRFRKKALDEYVDTAYNKKRGKEVKRKMEIIKSLIDMIASIASLAASIIALIVIRDKEGKK